MKQNSKRRIFCLLLALTMLFVCACTPTEDNPNSSVDTNSSSVEVSTEESKEAEGWVEGLEDLGGKYDGREFVIVTTSAAMFDSGKDTLLGKAIDRRKSLIMGKYGVDIIIREASAGNITTGMREAISKGTKYADLICAPADVLAGLANDGMLENMLALPCVDYSAGYMPKAEISEQTAGQTMYCFTGNVTMAANECTAVFFNKNTLSGMGIDPYSLVNSGAWTWSALKDVATEVAKKGNGGIYTTVDEKELTVTVYNSSGAKLVDEKDGKMVPSYDASAAAVTQSVMTELFGNEALAPQKSNEALLKEFAEGKIAMFIGKISDVEALENAKQEWGIVPIPKHSKNQKEYCTPVPSAAAGIAVPKNTGDSTFAGTMLNALFAATADSLESALKLTYVNYYFWSNDAAVMFYRICDKKIYDMGNIYSRILVVAEVGKSRLLDPTIAEISPEDLAAFDEFSKRLFVSFGGQK